MEPASLTVEDIANLTSILEAKAGLDGVSLIVPQGPTATRPASPSTARLRYNTQLGVYEGWLAGQWLAFSLEEVSLPPGH